MRALAVALLLSLAAPALAQEAAPHAGHGAPAQSHNGHTAPARSAVDSASADAFAAANAKMHADMDFDYTGDPDVAFVKGMIAHHQGAVDMANVILQFGEDEEIATFARKVIADQSAEIAWMREWLAKRGE
ncbi:MAG TPA: DUF305 domain-containing protein [Devosiaceae bacterium]|jgi:uncharacterized protein (DUF305 family)|nr:DUF305 domain-containing protein [Devosiaceae bacterium]